MSWTSHEEVVSLECPSYEYDALEGAQHIRIMLLQPALDATAPIHFSFVQGHYLDLVGKYAALSYTWGQAKLTCPVYVENGQLLFVTENLDQALRRLRCTSETCWLWADAVCINQSNNDEKGTQIPLMVRIFRSASRVLAWLGPDESLGKSTEHLGILSRLSRAEIDFYMQQVADGPLPATLGLAIDPMLNLLNLPWFSRLWIIQEVVFNSNVILICGNSELHWTRLTSAAAILKNIGAIAPGSAACVKIDAIERIWKLWRDHCFIDEFSRRQTLNALQIRGKREDDIIELIETFQDYGCTDPRDRIFALYSMTPTIVPTHLAHASTSKDAVLMNVEYRLDVRQTYQEFAIACMNSGRAGEIVSALLSRQGTPVAADWPSWVPDWRKQPRKLPELTAKPIKVNLEYMPPNKALLDTTMRPWSLDRSCRPTVERVFCFRPTEQIMTCINRLGYSCRDIHRKRWTPPLNMSGWVKRFMPSGSLIHSTGVSEQQTSPSTNVDQLSTSLTDRHPTLEEPFTRDYDYIFNVTVRSGSPTTIFGYSPVPVLPGDRIYVVDVPERIEINRTGGLLLRPTHTTVKHHAYDQPIDSYRLIGSTLLLVDRLTVQRNVPAHHNDTDRVDRVCLE